MNDVSSENMAPPEDVEGSPPSARQLGAKPMRTGQIISACLREWLDVTRTE
jgi:hypothetical protein